MFVIILVSICKHKRNIAIQTKTKSSSFQTTKESLIIAISLAVVFGLGWGFGLLATSSSVEGITITFQVVFSIFVGLQGLLLFILHGLRNTHARKVWRQCAVSICGKSRVSYILSFSSRTGKPADHSHASGITSSTLPCTLPRKVNLTQMHDGPHYDEIKKDCGKMMETESEFAIDHNVSYGNCGSITESAVYENLTTSEVISPSDHYEFSDEFRNIYDHPQEAFDYSTPRRAMN